MIGVVRGVERPTRSPASPPPSLLFLTSIRDATPDVTGSESPPMGYPTTVTSSCSRGVAPNATAGGARGPRQKDSSSTARSAMSHSGPMARTRATNLVSSPRRRTWT